MSTLCQRPSCFSIWQGSWYYLQLKAGIPLTFSLSKNIGMVRDSHSRGLKLSEVQFFGLFYPELLEEACEKLLSKGMRSLKKQLTNKRLASPEQSCYKVVMGKKSPCKMLLNVLLSCILNRDAGPGAAVIRIVCKYSR